MKRVIGSVSSYQKLELHERDQMIDAIQIATSKILEKWGPEVNCFNFHLEIKARFPRAVCWRNPGHVITELDGLLFDKTGILFARKSLGDQDFKRAFNMPKINGENPCPS